MLNMKMTRITHRLVRILTCFAASAMLLVGASPAFAQYSSGTYTDRDGLSCSWYSYSESMVTTQCSGYSYRYNAFLSYSCDYTIWGQSVSWDCRSTDGAHWSGSN